MIETEKYENYPWWIICLFNLCGLVLYALGFIFLSHLNIWAGIGYLIYCLMANVNVMSSSCRYCYYYNKRCGPGLGKLATLFFKEGDKNRFIKSEFSYNEIIFNMLTVGLPLIGAFPILLNEFSWFFIILLVLLLTFGFFRLIGLKWLILCKHCRQGEIGCPLEQRLRHLPRC